MRASKPAVCKSRPTRWAVMAREVRRRQGDRATGDMGTGAGTEDWRCKRRRLGNLAVWNLGGLGRSMKHGAMVRRQPMSWGGVGVGKKTDWGRADLAVDRVDRAVVQALQAGVLGVVLTRARARALAPLKFGAVLESPVAGNGLAG